jgi:vitamin B12 transporter
MRHSLIFIALNAALASAAAHADEVDLQPTVQVTASRVAETVDQALADVSIVSRADIEASVARDVLEVLRLEAGVDLYRTGGPGQQTSLFLRGANSNQVLVLIDGVRAAAATTGAFAFEQLPLDAVERIEIVRGPRASYWGADALGGVIQIFTRRLDGPRAALGYGSYRDAAGSAGIGHWDGADGYSVQVGARHVGGFAATNPGICAGPDDPYCIYTGADSGLRKTNLTARGAHTLGSQLLSASLYRSQGEIQFDPHGRSSVIEQVAGVNVEGALGANWSHRLALGHSREDLNTPLYSVLYLTRRSSLLWQNEFRLGDGQRLVAGIDLVHDKGEARDIDAGTPRYRDSRDNRALFAGWRATFGALDGEVAARHDHDSLFGGASTGSAALGWRFGERWRAYASFGQGFRSPTMNELFDPGYGGWFAGNPQLAPERSRSTELGVEFTPTAQQQLKANLYSTRVRDLISFTGPQNQAENLAHAALDGAELGYRLDRGDWSAQATYTWQDARNADTDTPLLRRAKHKLSGLLERRFGEHLDAGVEVVYASRRRDVGGVELGGYALLNLRARCALTPAWDLRARLENLTDRRYELVRGYDTPGRSAFVEVTWTP